MKTIQQGLLTCLLIMAGAQIMAQQGNVAAGGDASGDGGSMSYSIGQTDYFTYISAQGSLNFGLQQPLLFFVPLNREIPTTVVSSGQIQCFDAQLTVTVAGDDKLFTLQSGGHAEIIAGQNILIRHGTTVESGGTFYAHISTVWCPPQQGMLAAFDEPVQIKALFEPEFTSNFFKVYPNPTTGDFTLEMLEFEETSMLLFEIFTMQGHLITRKELPTERLYNFSLTDRQPGIYLIRVFKSNEIGTGKIIKQ